MPLMAEASRTHERAFLFRWGLLVAYTTKSDIASTGLNSPESQGTSLLIGACKMGFSSRCTMSFTTLRVYHNDIYASNISTDIPIWYNGGMTERHKTPAKTIRLDRASQSALAYIKELYGYPSDNAAIKLALRLVARQPFHCETLSHPPTRPGTPPQ
jgi:hypothetical protein